jgi:hypothetical protein
MEEIFEILKKYKNNGVFIFNYSQSFKKQCNAPNDQSGVYLIFKIFNDKEVLIYIGSSGQKRKDGTIKIRKGGIKDRLINGYHPNRFGEPVRFPRHKVFPKQMRNEEIIELKIYWWITYNDENLDFPTDIEKKIREQYLMKNNKLPAWHQ